ncbi:MAG: helix-turn-helix domain-containing protein [Bacilli bacterium]
MRSKGGTNKYWTKEEKLKVVKEMLENQYTYDEMAEKTRIARGMIWTWKDKYLKYGEKSLENQKKPGNPLVKYSTKKNLNDLEKLEYENMKLRIELERLKKGYLVKGDGQNKEYISINKKNSK